MDTKPGNLIKDLEAERIERLKRSIEEAKEAIREGLIQDPEAESQLCRMIWYYEKEVKDYVHSNKLQD